MAEPFFSSLQPEKACTSVRKGVACALLEKISEGPIQAGVNAAGRGDARARNAVAADLIGKDCFK